MTASVKICLDDIFCDGIVGSELSHRYKPALVVVYNQSFGTYNQSFGSPHKFIYFQRLYG